MVLHSVAMWTRYKCMWSSRQELECGGAAFMVSVIIRDYRGSGAKVVIMVVIMGEQ